MRNAVHAQIKNAVILASMIIFFFLRKASMIIGNKGLQFSRKVKRFGELRIKFSVEQKSHEQRVSIDFTPRLVPQDMDHLKLDFNSSIYNSITTSFNSTFRRLKIISYPIS